MSRLKGKFTVVTAAGQGIGRETAIMFAREGAKVLATDINKDSLDSLAQEYPEIRVAKLDVTSQENISTIIGAENRIDVLFNCAGYVAAGNILECSPEDWARSFSINVDSMYHMSRAVLPGMLDRGQGNIINMSSVASSILGVPNRFAYGTTKAAVIGFTKAVASDFVSKGIRCNAICPGTVQSPSLDERLRATGDYEKARSEFIERQPMGRVGKAEEVAALATYLASDESAFTTGTTHTIDGGWSV